MIRCGHRTGQLLVLREEGRLEDAARHELESHLRACPSCRQEAGAVAPLTLFSGLAGAERPLPSGVEAFILGGLRVAEAPPPPRRWRLEPLAAAAFLAAAALILIWATTADGPRRVGPEPSTPGLARAEMPLAPHAMTNAVTTVEDIRSTTAEVFAFSVPGGSAGSTEVILIVDRSIDL